MKYLDKVKLIINKTSGETGDSWRIWYFWWKWLFWWNWWWVSREWVSWAFRKCVVLYIVETRWDGTLEDGRCTECEDRITYKLQILCSYKKTNASLGRFLLHKWWRGAPEDKLLPNWPPSLSWNLNINIDLYTIVKHGKLKFLQFFFSTYIVYIIEVI